MQVSRNKQQITQTIVKIYVENESNKCKRKKKLYFAIYCNKDTKIKNKRQI